MNHYPFSAIVGQNKLKRALLLCAVNPSIGGVLIKGEKGTAKSTAARGLSSVMPMIQRVSGSLFNTSEKEKNTDIQFVNQSSELEDIAVPFVDLPLGASEDRVLGSLDLEAIVSEKKKKFLPGLLAGAHRGILYIDEVNLLQDHLVDILLDVAASGINTVQREGLSVSHPSKFILIGTMNPEEGNLRPQFLDRFGLMVEVESQMDVKERTEVVRRRMSFENNPEQFLSQWVSSQQTLQNQIKKAQQLLPQVEMPEGLLTLISQLCIEWSVSSLRADIVLYKTAVTLAALADRKTVTADDVKQAAELVLVHRKGKRPFEQNKNPQAGQNPENGNKISSDQNQDSQSDSESKSGEIADGECGDGPEGKGICPPEQSEKIFQPLLQKEIPQIRLELPVTSENLLSGRRTKAIGTVKGFQVRTEKNPVTTDLAFSETIQHALLRDPDHLQITKEDLHQKIKSGRAGHLILFVVDASGSMAAGKRMEAVKGSVLSLLKDAYQKRDMVGVISFRGVEAEILLEPTLSIDLAEKALETLPTGGRTPLAHAMQLAEQVLDRYKNERDLKPLLVILSDGKANVPVRGGGDPWQQTLQIAAMIQKMHIPALVLDTENGYLRFGRAAELAKVLGGECLSLDDLSSDEVTRTVSLRINN
ncbi:magnesium chelatase subunit D family protein [Dyadobacter psychrotolerans]|uniref:Mg-protoporphyrin IX chelatase n=1 Tax=Dyadobacter psychrotolerans TaxID=2541721 RepID=A0A4R5DUY1_9BACT|nr:magnesium chelatase subunit D family protein [Dyadobacter psychrotolerans]TDE18346.1 VWA domain-containing protein [Dyadobacter psychrotolerans]